MPSDLDIARATPLRPIGEIAAKLDIPADALRQYGQLKAKVDLNWLKTHAADQPPGKLVLVTAVSPTPAGEGKTTTTIGLADSLRSLGYRAAAALREPSLGPCFGMKGGATGGGRAQIAPMDEINLHFTGDFHAIGSAHNLLAALIDNHVYWGNALDLDTRRLAWRRVLDMNDRALRQVVTGLGGNGAVREDGFDITVASEVMAAFCLAADAGDLQARLDRMVIGQDRSGAFVAAAKVNGTGALSALLAEALHPNLVQTLEGTPAFVHGGPFANIAHGCNSVIATKAALSLADIVVTEAGFGADLGAEKFLNVKCRAAGLRPDAAVVVATLRALKMHGGVAKADLGREDVAAVERGLANLKRHVQNLHRFGLPVLVALNAFTADTDAEYAALADACRTLDVPVHRCTHWADGGAGAHGLARAVVDAIATPAPFRPLYPDDMPLADKIRTVATDIYGADGVQIAPAALRRLGEFEAAGFRSLPICMAKTQYSFSADPTLLGAPSGFTLPIREVRLRAGAGFVVALAGDIMTMPGLPRHPAAESIGLDADGQIFGLF